MANGKASWTTGRALLTVQWPEQADNRKFLVLGMSAWRKSKTVKISLYKGLGWRFFWRSVPEGQKNTTRPLYREKPINFRRSVQVEKSIQELLTDFFELDRKGEKNKIRKLESDESGFLLLNPNNESDREWYENDEDYDVI